MGYSPWDHKESDTTERLSAQTLLAPCRLLSLLDLKPLEKKDGILLNLASPAKVQHSVRRVEDT